MKKIIVTFAVTVGVLSASAYTDFFLDRVCRNAVRVSEQIWDFSETESVRAGMRHRVYGDSAVSEVSGSGRLWYLMRNDSVFFNGSESRQHRLVPEREIPTSAFNSWLLAAIGQERDSGLRYCSVAVGSCGEYESTLPVHGVIEAAGELRFMASAVTERRSLITREMPDTAASVYEEHMRTRWFVEGREMPVAVMVSSVFRNEEGKKLKEEDIIYCCDFGSLPEVEDARVPEDIPGGITAEYSGGHIILHNPAGAVFSCRTALASVEGNLVFDRILCFSGEESVSAECGCLSPGRYVLTLGAGTDNARKLYVGVY